MSGQPTFRDVFVEACRIKGISKAQGIVFSTANYSDGELGRPILLVGGIDDALWFHEGGIRFNRPKAERRFTWDELSFVLPEDLSIVGDQLRAFSDIEWVADHASRTTAQDLVKYGAYAFGAYVLYTILAPSLHWFDSASGIIGLAITTVLVAFVLSLGAIPLALAGLGTLTVAGGLLSWITSVVCNAIKPFAKAHYARYGQFANGITILDKTWMKMPWGLPTTEVLDLILLGMKLKRRGIAPG